MSNLTLSIDDTLLKRARIRALEEGTSVNAVVREFLTAYAGGDPTEPAILRFIERATQFPASSGSEGRSWTREGLHDRAVLR